ncbi:hypothetical protein JCM10213_001349 [Rhodosporidiobolus nylandii]
MAALPPLPVPPSPVLAQASPASSDAAHYPFDTPYLSRTPTLKPLEVDDRNQSLPVTAGAADEEGLGEHEGQSLPPIDRGKGAWGFVAAAFLLETFIWGYSYSFATILVYLESHDPWQKEGIASLSAVGTTQLGIQFILPLFFTLIFRRYPENVKPCMWISVVVNVGSMLLSSWATQVWQLIILQGVLCGISGAALYTPVFLWLSEWWVEKRGLATGIIFAGTGTGGFAFPFLINALLATSPTDGFKWMCRGWALITLVVFVASAFLIGPRVPPPKRTQGWRFWRERRDRGPWLGGKGELRSLRNPIFGLMVYAALLSSLSTLPVSINLGLYAASLASSTTTFQRELVVSLFNLSASIGCAVTGFFSDFSYAHATTMCGLISGLVALAEWGLAESLEKTYGFAVLFGFFSQQVAAWSGAAKDISGSSPHTATLVFCLFSIVRGVASIVMPFVSETLYDPEKSGQSATWGSGGFKKMIIFVGITGFLSAMGGVALQFVRQRRRKAGK